MGDTTVVSNPLHDLSGRVASAVERATTIEARAVVLGGLLGVVDEAIAQLAEVPATLRLALGAVERWRVTRDARELEALRGALSVDLGAIEAEGDGRTIHVAWAVWNLTRVAENLESSSALAAARARDCVTHAFEAIVWEPPGAKVSSAERRATAVHAASVLAARWAG